MRSWNGIVLGNEVSSHALARIILAIQPVPRRENYRLLPTLDRRPRSNPSGSGNLQSFVCGHSSGLHCDLRGRLTETRRLVCKPLCCCGEKFPRVEASIGLRVTLLISRTPHLALNEYILVGTMNGLLRRSGAITIRWSLV